MESLQPLLEQLNQQLKSYGLLELALVRPEDCLPQKKNARYFKPQLFQQLVNNVKAAGALESTPLVYRSTTQPGKYHIISGHHRVDAAKAAGLEFILVFVDQVNSHDEVVSKQLAHNALTGEDDKLILTELFQSIQDIQLKFATGLADDITPISYTSLNFKIGEFKEFCLLFLPDELNDYDAQLDEIIKDLTIKPSTAVRVTSISYYDKFVKSLAKLKKVENIKSNGAAILRMAELAIERIKQIEAEASADNESTEVA